MMCGSKCKNRTSSQGFSTLLFTLVVLLSVTLLVFISANSVVSNQQVVASYHKVETAFNAAQAGLDHAVAYLDENQDTITDGDTITGTLGNGGSYTVTFNFKDGKNLIEMISVGSASGGDSTKQVKQLAKFVAEDISSTLVDRPVLSRGPVDITLFSWVTNNVDGSEGLSIRSGNTVTLSNVSTTIIDGSISSTPSNTEGDIAFNDLTMSGMSDSELASQTLGYAIDNLIADATSTTKNDLDGLGGGIYYLSGSVNINNNTSDLTVGTEDNPATLIVDGNLNLKGRTDAKVIIHGTLVVRGNLTLDGAVTVNGLAYVENSSSTPTLTSGARVNGALVSANDSGATVKWLASVVYNKELVDNAVEAISSHASTTSGLVVGSYGKVSGSWVDLN